MKRSRFFARAVERERKRFLGQIRRALNNFDPDAPMRSLTPLERKVLEELRRRWERS
jgi:hypothetical protein